MTDACITARDSRMMMQSFTPPLSTVNLGLEKDEFSTTVHGSHSLEKDEFNTTVHGSHSLEKDELITSGKFLTSDVCVLRRTNKCTNQSVNALHLPTYLCRMRDNKAKSNKPCTEWMQNNTHIHTHIHIHTKPGENSPKIGTSHSTLTIHTPHARCTGKYTPDRSVILVLIMIKYERNKFAYCIVIHGDICTMRHKDCGARCDMVATIAHANLHGGAFNTMTMTIK